jgi:MinD-like ATPase involved in chromosome partitioning or flagellar assembly
MSTPVITVDAQADGTATLVIGGTPRALSASSLEDVIDQAIRVIVEEVAAPAGGAVTVHARDPRDGDMTLSVTPTGHVNMLPLQQRPEPAPAPVSAPVPIQVPAAIVAPEPQSAEAKQPAPAQRAAAAQQAAPAATPEVLPTRREARQSFLTQESVEEPAQLGWRGIIGRVGVRLNPSHAERAERTDIANVSQHWPGPRTIAIVNGKGGAGKTPSAVLLSAVFARYGGAGVLAWDNNQTRGTLGWRTEQGPHEATLLDLLPQSENLLSTAAQSADLAYFVHHQKADKYDVLRSKPMALADQQRLDAADVDAIHRVASKYYRLIFIDSGNDESDPMWRRMIEHTDQLVVVTTTRVDHAEAGALLLEALADRDESTSLLAQEAVVVVSQADEKASAADVERVSAGYRALAREAVAIPFDPAMVDGILRYGSLRQPTQRAWLHAAAAIAQGL